MKVIIAISLALSIGFIASPALAEDLSGRFNVGIVGGGVFPSNDNIENSFYVGGNLAYGINNYLALGGEVGYSLREHKEGGEDFDDTRAIPLLADVYLRYPVEIGEHMFVPYGIGGAGAIFYECKEESGLLNRSAIKVDRDPELGLKAGAGLDFFFTENIALNLEGSYLWSEADTSTLTSGVYSVKRVDMDAGQTLCGVKYYF